MRTTAIIIALILAAACGTRQAAAQTFSSDDWKNLRDSDRGMLLLDSDSSLPTAVLLRALRWDSLVAACKVEAARQVDQSYTDVYQDSLLTRYEYARQGGRTRIDITDYRGSVLSYSIGVENSLRPVTGSYFDKPLWLRYAHEMLGSVADSLKLSVDEAADILRAYYRLLGVGVSSEYGWICEYGAAGSAPAQRAAVVHLVVRERPDLLRRALQGPSLEGRVYAADALLYLDHLARPKLQSFLSDRPRRIRELGSLQPEILAGWIRQLDEEQERIESRLLTKQDSMSIEALRSSGAIVRTCGNAGSYRIYPVPIHEVLSDSAIHRIPEQYEILRNFGYLQ